MKEWQVALLLGGFLTGVWAGWLCGAHMASEHFYDECLSVEMNYKSPAGWTLTAVGCAEVARHIR